MCKESINIFDTNTLQLRKALKSGGGKTLKTDLAGFLTFAQDIIRVEILCRSIDSIDSFSYHNCINIVTCTPY